ncbi:MFS transporter [Gilliamella apicola]|uniref:MFS transporter n=1 Tax=Gilliamella apicola TaxID=1196095 RepID=UPI00080E40E8|nr:MFS transporter [Gilliamella apicola]OCG12870.1 MFS transporter [Gilliamella apicola]ORF45173.1 MFS transporter [Gilliamella apicola]ORF48479.1 MFS transporter [Gilliamella apicola]ORF51534.1 MFS transporter [Gilliamella apicola]ORF52486.1 MFS transporter [Gilliamella apicola]
MKTESNSAKQVESEQTTPYQKKTLFASTVGYALDGMDMMILGVCFSLISVSFNLSKTDLGTLTSVTLLGAVLGGILFGVLADKYGRVRVFSWTILIFSLFTGLCAISPNYESFLIFRFLSGLGLGGEFGIGMTLVSESWPKNKRSRATSIVALGFQAGIILSTLTVNFVGQSYGWRWAFAVGVLPALFVAWTRKGLDEPEIWQNLKDQNKNEIAVGKLFKTPKTTATTIGLTIACAVQNFGFYGLMVWMPSMIASELKLPFKDTLYWTISTTIGMSLGILIFGWLCDKFGRRPSYIIFLLISAVSIWFYFQQTDMIILIIFGSAIGFFVNGMMGGYGALLAEHYPTDARSSAENIIFNVGRGIAGISQVLIAYFATMYSISYALALLSATYLLSAAAFVFLIPETKGKALE